MKDRVSVVMFKNVNKFYNRGAVKALDNATFSVGRGEIVLVIGENGAGKTTVLKLISGLVFPTSGTVKTFGDNIEQNKNRLGILFESNYIYPNLSGFYNIILLTGKDVTLDKVYSVAKDFGLSRKLLLKKAKGLSYGQTRRLLLTTVVLRNPDLFLLDEPFNGLDYNGIRALLSLILNGRENDKTFIITGQNISYVKDIVDRIIWLNEGKILYDGKPAEISAMLQVNAIVEAENPNKFSAFLHGKNIKFYLINNTFFVEATVAEMEKMKAGALQNGIKFLKFTLNYIGYGGQTNENITEK